MDLPDSMTLASIHNDLLIYEKLSDALHGGKLSGLATQQTVAKQIAKLCKRELETLVPAFDAIEEAGWLRCYYERDLTGTQNADSDDPLEGLFEQMGALVKKRSARSRCQVLDPAREAELYQVRRALGHSLATL